MGWIRQCLEETIADCLHYYGVDITRLPGHLAIPLAADLKHFWTVIPDTDPPRWRSAVVPVLMALHEDQQDNDEERLLMPADIAAFGGDYKRG